MSGFDANLLDTMLDALVERIADLAAEKVVERLGAEGWAPAQPVEEQLLDVEATAARLQVPRSGIYKMATSGQLPAVKVGARLRFRLSDIEEFITQATRSEERVRALAASARAVATQPQHEPHRGSASRRDRGERTMTRDGSSERPAPAAAALKVLTNNDPDDAPTRRAGG